MTPRTLNRVTLWLLLCLASPVAAESGRPAIDEICGSLADAGGQVVSFPSKAFLGGDVAVSGVLTLPADNDMAPGLVLLHTAAGLEPPECYARIRAMFRDWGYATLLVDVASGGGQTPKRSYEASIRDWREDLLAAVRHLASEPGVDPQRIGAVGWSRGALALLYAASVPSESEQPEGRATLRAAIGFYPTCPRQLDRMTFPFLLLHGEADQMAPIDSCRSMTVKGAEQDHLEFIELEGARHFFDHPNRSEHHPRAAEIAWSQVRVFLDRNLESAK